MRSNVLEFLGGAFWIVVFLYFEFFGVFHAFKSHGSSDGLLSVFVPPVAWYRAVEFWWHDDYRGLDWTKRVDEDATLIAYLLNASYDTDPETKRKSIETVSFVKDRVLRYPTERREEVESLSRAYCEFIVALSDELASYFEEHKYDEFLPQFSPSFDLGKRVSHFDGYPQLADLVQSNVSAVQTMFKEESSSPDSDKIQAVLDAMVLAKTRSMSTMGTTFRDIFAKELRFDESRTVGTPP